MWGFFKKSTPKKVYIRMTLCTSLMSPISRWLTQEWLIARTSPLKSHRSATPPKSHKNPHPTAKIHFSTEPPPPNPIKTYLSPTKSSSRISSASQWSISIPNVSNRQLRKTSSNLLGFLTLSKNRASNKETGQSESNQPTISSLWRLSQLPVGLTRNSPNQNRSWLMKKMILKFMRRLKLRIGTLSEPKTQGPKVQEWNGWAWTKTSRSRLSEATKHCNKTPKSTSFPARHNSA